MNKQEIKQILIREHLRPLREMRQNFLIDQTSIKKLIKFSHLKEGDVVMEIGAGLGSITELVAQKAKEVIAIEKDKSLVKFLRKKFRSGKNVRLIQEDVLNMDLSQLKFRKYKVIANLPFNITFRVIKQFLETNNRPELLTFIVQKEEGERLCPQTKKNNFWSIFVQLYAQAEIVGHINRRAFWPQPKVEAVVISIKPKSKVEYNRDLLRLVKIGFQSPRKQLINNLREGLKVRKEEVKKWLRLAHISEKVRAEEVSLEDWKRLMEVAIKKFKIQSSKPKQS